MDCLHHTAEETGSKRLEVVPKDSLANNWQKKDLGFHFGIPNPLPYQLYYICHAAIFKYDT